VHVLWYPSNNVKPRKRVPVVNNQIPSEPVHVIEWYDVPTIDEIIAEKQAKEKQQKNVARDSKKKTEEEKWNQIDEKLEEDCRPVVTKTSLSDVSYSPTPLTASHPRLDVAQEKLVIADVVIEHIHPKQLSPKRVIEPKEVKREEDISIIISEKSTPKRIPLSKKSIRKQNTISDNTVSNKTKIERKSSPKKKTNTLSPQKKKRELSIAEIKKERKTDEDFIARAAHELRFWKAKLKQEATEAAQEEERRAKAARRNTASRLRWWDSMIGIRNHEVCWLRENKTWKLNVESRPLKLIRRSSPRTVPISKTQLDQKFAKEEYISSDLRKSMSKIRQKMQLSAANSLSTRTAGDKVSRPLSSKSNRKINAWKTDLKVNIEGGNPGDRVSAKMLHQIGDWINLTPSPRESLGKSGGP